MTSSKWSIGSKWRRWEPHIHAPGTLRNDLFQGKWDEYIKKIEEATPRPVALGITDYFTLRSYKEVLKKQKSGALSKVKLIFANVELRLTIETKDRQGINLHLLVSPDDPNHVSLIEQKLSQLSFSFDGQVYLCKDDDLIRLGKAHKKNPKMDDEGALKEGANQFKVNFDELRILYQTDTWFRNNVLVAVAAGDDGLSGLSEDASFSASRKEIAKFSQIIFSGSPKERTFWLGNHTDFESNGYQPKPCLHGSDAHKIDDVLAPTLNRYSWVRAEPTFEGLRQILVEPDRRVFIGEEPPDGPSPSEVIREVKLENAPWLLTPDLKLSSGLVAVIGSKGSGKTALADLLAYAANAEDSEPGPASFLSKAEGLLDGVNLKITWGDKGTLEAPIPRDSSLQQEPRVRYLSQQFVERLCTPTGFAEPLQEEIERIVFFSIPEEDQLQCSSFSELRSLSLENPLAEQEAEREIIRSRTRTIAQEHSLQISVPGLNAQLKEVVRDRLALKKEIDGLPLKGTAKKVEEQKRVAAGLKILVDTIAAEDRKTQNLNDLVSAVQRQNTVASENLEVLKKKYEGLLETSEWDQLLFRLHPNAITTLDKKVKESRDRTTSLRNNGLPANPAQKENPAPQGLDKLKKQNEDLIKALGLDATNAKRQVDLEKRFATITQTEDNLKKRLETANTAGDRIKNSQSERLSAYEAVFKALEDEKKTLIKLYNSLSKKLTSDPLLGKLSFFVHREVDLRAWVKKGGSLLDLRKPPFQGQKALEEAATKYLLKAWKSGTPEMAKTAMQNFIQEFGAQSLQSLAQEVTPMEFGEWLFSTDHIRVQYGIQYEGVDLVHLSPGTRGVVLLTLYLALDEWDQRPLIIDQPEENLDPRSVFDDLVPFFRRAAVKRQIILVTHNANLVVNTDADQVIIAEAKRNSPVGLPEIHYSAGGLEDRDIRADVCRLLEGGEDAFKKRGLRYGIQIFKITF